MLGSYQERCTQDWWSRSVVFVKPVRNQLVPQCAEWWGEMDNWETTSFGHCPSTAFLPVWSECTNTRQSKKILTASLRRSRGDHRYTLILRGWRLKTIWQDLKSNNLSLNEATDVVQNRLLWRLMSMFGVTHSQWCMAEITMMTVVQRQATMSIMTNWE